MSFPYILYISLYPLVQHLRPISAGPVSHYLYIMFEFPKEQVDAVWRASGFSQTFLPQVDFLCCVSVLRFFSFFPLSILPGCGYAAQAAFNGPAVPLAVCSLPTYILHAWGTSRNLLSFSTKPSCKEEIKTPKHFSSWWSPCSDCTGDLISQFENWVWISSFW